MRAPGFKVVGETLARNPVARAVAQANTVAAVNDFLLCAYLWPDGSKQRAPVLAASTVLAVSLRLMDAAGDAGSPDFRVMTGAMSALAQCSERGFKWHTRDAPAIDAGLTRALEVFKGATASAVRDAWDYVRKLEGR